MAQEFLYHAQQLYGGSGGSFGQNQSNQWLMKLKESSEAYTICLSILQLKQEPGQDNVIFLALQILKQTLELFWFVQYSLRERVHIREGVLKFLSTLSTHSFSFAIQRAAYSTMARIITKSVLEWPQWNTQLMCLLNIDARNLSIVLNILGMLPEELDMLIRNQQIDGNKLSKIQASLHYQNINLIPLLSSTLEQRLSHHNLVLDALHCLENWVGLSSRVGEEGDLGVSLLALHESGLLDAVMQKLDEDNVDQLKVSTSIMLDVLAIEIEVHDREAFQLPTSSSNQQFNCILKVAAYLFQQQPSLELLKNRLLKTANRFESYFEEEDTLLYQKCESLCQIAYSLAEHHSIILWAPGWFYSKRRNEGCPVAFEMNLLEYLANFVSIQSPHLISHTLEFWHFILNFPEKVQGCELAAVGDGGLDGVWRVLLPVVQNVLLIMVNQCTYPEAIVTQKNIELNGQWFDDLNQLRKEVEETVHSICEQWPLDISASSITLSPTDTFINLLFESNSVAQLESALFGLKANLIALAEKSEGDDDEDSDETMTTSRRSVPKDIQVSQWKRIFEQILNLPMYPLVSLSCIRFIHVTSTWLFCEHFCFVQAIRFLCKSIIVVPQVRSDAAKTLAKVCRDAAVLSVDVAKEAGNLIMEMYDLPQFQQRIVDSKSIQDIVESILALSTHLSDSECLQVTSRVLSPLMNSFEAMTKRQASPSSSQLSQVLEVLSIISHGMKSIPKPYIANQFVQQAWPIISQMTNFTPGHHDHHWKENSEAIIQEAVLEFILHSFKAMKNQFTLDCEIHLPMIEILVQMHRQEGGCCGARVLECLKKITRLTDQVIGMQSIFSTVFQSLCSSMYLKLNIEMTRPMAEIHETLKLQHSHQQGMFGDSDELLVFFSLEKVFLYVHPTVFLYQPPGRRDGFILLDDCLQLATVFLAIDLDDHELIYAILNFIGALMTPTSGAISETHLVAAFRAIAFPLLRAIFYMFLRPASDQNVHPPSLIRNVSNFMYQILHSKTTSGTLKDVFRNQALPNVFKDQAFLATLRCGWAQSHSICEALLVNQTQVVFRRFFKELVEFFQHQIDFPQLHFPKGRT